MGSPVFRGTGAVDGLMAPPPMTVRGATGDSLPGALMLEPTDCLPAQREAGAG